MLAVAAAGLVLLTAARVAAPGPGAATRGLGGLPAGARALVSRTVGQADPRFAVRRHGPGWIAGNPSQGIRLSFGHGRATVESGELTWSLGLRAIGHGASLTSVPLAAPTARANSVAFIRPGLTEWYANGPLGLEQGFTLARRPRGGQRGPLTLALGLPAGVGLRLLDHGHGLVLGDSGTAPRGPRTAPLYYSGLSALDASGHALRAWLDVRAGRLLVRVDDSGARYPLRVDPFVQAKLTASGGGAGDALGFSAAVSGDGSTIVVGAVGANSLQGAAYVFTRGLGGWATESAPATLTASDGTSGNQFGWSVGVSEDGSVVIVGDPFAPVSSNSHQGEAYVFTRPVGGWSSETEAAKLTNPTGGTGDELGWSVAVSGDGTLAVAGAPGVNSGTGAAYIFTSSGGSWSPLQTLTAADGAGGDALGTSIAMASDRSTIVAGAPGASASQGAAYVFEPRPTFPFGWGQFGKLTAADGAAGDRLGSSVALTDATVIAGAPDAKINSTTAQGAAYIFLKPFNPVLNTWKNATSTAKLTSGDGAANDYLGWSVGLSGDGSVAVAGAPTTNSLPTAGHGPGSAYLFARPSSGWKSATETAKLTAADGVAGDAAGWSVGLSSAGSTIAVSAPRAKIAGNAEQGAGYEFTDTTSTAASCQPTTVLVGQSSTCSATVTDTGSGIVTPTGSVSFKSDSSGAFGSGGSCALAAAASAGTASCHVSYTPTAEGSGTHTISSTYGGDAGHAGSSSPTQLAVSLATTSTSVQCQQQLVAVGSADVCTALVTDTGPRPSPPTQSVSFTTDSSGSFTGGGACTLTPADATASSCSVSYTPAAVGFGTHEITTRYGSDPAHTASLGTTQIGVELASSSLSLRCVPAHAAVRTSTTCTASVADTSSGSLTPSGRVQFTTGGPGRFGGGAICTLAGSPSPGVASCHVSYTPSGRGSGTHTLTAGYGGDSNHFAATGRTSVTVGQPLPQVTVTGRKLRAAHGAVTFALRCPAGETFCAGTLSLYAGTHRVLLARGQFRISGGKSGALKVRLRTQALGAPRGHTSLRVTVVISAHDRARRSATTTTNGITLVLSGPAHG